MAPIALKKESNALHLLTSGEICNVMVEGHLYEAIWNKQCWGFFLSRPEEASRGSFCHLNEIDEWWPAGVKFQEKQCQTLRPSNNITH